MSSLTMHASLLLQTAKLFSLVPSRPYLNQMAFVHEIEEAIESGLKHRAAHCFNVFSSRL